MSCSLSTTVRDCSPLPPRRCARTRPMRKAGPPRCSKAYPTATICRSARSTHDARRFSIVFF